MIDLKSVLVSQDIQLDEAIASIDLSGKQVVLVLNEDRRLAGMLTDGDVRRAILGGKSLQTPIKELMNSKPIVASANTPRETLLALMRRYFVHHLPLVDIENRVVDLATLDDLISARERPNWVILMAGGLGIRLRPLTADRPKPMLHIAGKPILESILESFIEQGFRNFFVSVNYKAEMITDYFGNGDKWGVEIVYLYESQRLGTAGALSLLPARPANSFIVMNGDILTRISFENLIDFHEKNHSIATMAVREYDHQVPYGVVRTDGAQLKSIEEKPTVNFSVNAGIYALSPRALDQIPLNQYFDMTSLFERLLIMKDKVTAYPLKDYWLDIGRLAEFERAQSEWSEA